MITAVKIITKCVHKFTLFCHLDLGGDGHISAKHCIKHLNNQRAAEHTKRGCDETTEQLIKAQLNK